MNAIPSTGRALALALVAGTLLAACGSPAEQATPTLSSEQVQTQAVATFEAALTATALGMPTATPTATHSPTPAVTSTRPATNTPSAAATAVGIAPTASCYGLRFVSDVTIPDDTKMTPGQQFTKTWRVRNSGTCDWAEGFKLSFTGGEKMGGSAVTLDDDVEPGEEEDLSVKMTAPNANGTYRGNWRMTTDGGAIFGDEVYVRIIVGGSTATATAKASATVSVTPQASATSSPTATATLVPSDTPTETSGP